MKHSLILLLMTLHERISVAKALFLQPMQLPASTIYLFWLEKLLDLFPPNQDPTSVID